MIYLSISISNNARLCTSLGNVRDLHLPTANIVALPRNTVGHHLGIERIEVHHRALEGLLALELAPLYMLLIEAQPLPHDIQLQDLLPAVSVFIRH